MRPEDIRVLLRQAPFQPFRLVSTDGTAYAIRHPEVVYVGRSTLRLTLRAGTPALQGERVVIVALLHVIRVEMIEASTSPSVN
jgi:hypothetical protein